MSLTRLQMLGSAWTVVSEVVAMIDDRAPLPDRADLFAKRVAELLERDGWTVETEVVVPSRGIDSQRGRVDMVAEFLGFRIAIECDNKSPRTKSLHKLLQLDVNARLVILRRMCPLHALPSGIVVFGVEVEPW